MYSAQNNLSALPVRQTGFVFGAVLVIIQVLLVGAVFLFASKWLPTLKIGHAPTTQSAAPSRAEAALDQEPLAERLAPARQ